MIASFPIVVASSSVSLCMFWLLIPVAVYCLYKGYQQAAHKLLLEHTPTTDCGGVSPGRVELKAEAVSDEPLNSPLTDKKVVYYKYRIEEEQQSDSGQGGWKEVASGERSRPFYLHDDSGRVRIDPSGAEFHAETVVDRTVNSGHSLFRRGPQAHMDARRRRCFEEHIAVDSDVYIFGSARSRQDLGVPEVHAGRQDEPFIISTVDESYLADRYGRQATIYFWIGGVTSVLLPVLGTMMVGGMDFAEALEAALIPTFIIGLGVAGIIWALRRMKHGEFLTDLGNRMKEAEALMRRECHHRERLLARLVQSVRPRVSPGDQGILDSVAETRKEAYSQATFQNIRRLCPMINAQSDALERVFMVVEKYDVFQSDEKFYELLEELTRCEKQVMMARNFYNDAVWRLRQQPESMVGDTQATRALTFNEFERKPIDVVLPEDPQNEYGGDFVSGRSPRERKRAQQATTQRMEPQSGPQQDDTGGSVQIEESMLDEMAAATEAAILEQMGQGQRGGSDGGGKTDQPGGPPQVPPVATTEGGDPTRRGAVVEDGGEVSAPMPAEEPPSFEPTTESFKSTLDFNDGPTMEGIGNFGDIGRFGATRRFDEIGSRRSGDSEAKEREPFGFGRGERAALSSTDWDSGKRWGSTGSYGFDDSDRRFGFDAEEKSVLQAFADDESSKKKR